MDALPHVAPAPQGLASIKDACQFLALSRVSIYQQTRAGNLRGVKLGRAVRYSWEELERAAREGLPTLKKPAPAPESTAQANQGAGAAEGKRRRGRPRKSAAVLGQGQGGAA